MHYELYIDSLLFSNLMLNLYLLTLTNISTLRTATPQRICLGALLGALGFILPFIGMPVPFVGILVGIAVGTVGMLLVTFRVRRWKTFVCLVRYMLVYSFCMGGSLLFLGNVTDGFREILSHPLGLVSMGGVVFGLICGIKKNGYGSSWNCTAKLRNGEKTMEVPALIDSGNSLVEPISGKPVCVVDKRIYESLWGNSTVGFRVIPYHSVGKKRGILPAYLLEELEIDYEGMLLQFKSVYVAVGEERISGDGGGGSVKIIVNPMLFREKRNGRSLRRQNERRNDFESGNAGKNAV